jgi:hypothetical protein
MEKRLIILPFAETDILAVFHDKRNPKDWQRRGLKKI